MKVLIPGISGRLGRMVAERLHASGHEVAGIDRRSWSNAPRGVEVFEEDIRKRGAEEVFRRMRPDAVIHMATVTHLVAPTEDRYRINLFGTRAVLEHCHRYGAKRCIFVGRHTYYGAASDSALYHTEEDPPMAGRTFPELADLVAADLYAGSALWRFPELDTLVLRCCYTLGPSLHGTLAMFLKGKRVPVIMGYDPLFHFMHEEDVAAAICLALEKGQRGVYNVAGPSPVPLSLIVNAVGRTPVPVPEQLFRWMTGRFGMAKLPPGAIEHLKFPVVIDAKRFKDMTGFQHQHSEEDTLRAYAQAWPGPRMAAAAI
jgi:UDP-glucose 4-epimerase